jgi:[ribosomal protein S18]-alanine N-acetyltransferase
VGIRRANSSDIPAMIALDRQTVTAAHWSEQQYQRLFAPTDSAVSSAIAFVAEDEPEEKKICKAQAFLIAHQVDAEWELQNLVVSPSHRQQGIATGLVEELVEAIRDRKGAVIFLEVRESNQAARSLYKKLGFEETGLRKSYYSNPPENAIICRLRF